MSSSIEKVSTAIFLNSIHIGTSIDAFAVSKKNPENFERVLSLVEDAFTKQLEESSEKAPFVKRLKVEGSDWESIKKATTATNGPPFGKAFDFINEGFNKKEKILIHCGSGQIRSPTLIFAWLIEKLDWTFQKTYNLMVEKIPNFKPDPCTLEKLKEMAEEKRLRKELKKGSDNN